MVTQNTTYTRLNPPKTEYGCRNGGGIRKATVTACDGGILNGCTSNARTQKKRKNKIDHWFLTPSQPRRSYQGEVEEEVNGDDDDDIGVVSATLPTYMAVSQSSVTRSMMIVMDD